MPKPVLQSLILADHVYEDKLTGKRIIAGVFNRIIRGVRVVKEMPAPPPPAPPPNYAPQAPLVVQPPPYAAPEAAPQAPAVQPQAAAPPPTAAPQAPSPDYIGPGQPAVPEAPAQPQVPAASPAQAVPQSAAPEPPTAAQVPRAPAPSAPATPPQTTFTPPPIQPGQRVLEIPPTGLQSGSPFAYLSVTEVRGVTPFVLQLVCLDDDTQLFRSDLRVECHNPLYTVELTVPLPPIAPPNAGIYALELLYNGEILGSLRIVVEDAS